MESADSSASASPPASSSRHRPLPFSSLAAASASKGGSPAATASPNNLSTQHESSQLLSPTPAAFPSPMRQHRRTPSQHRPVKETLDAVYVFADDEDDGISHHKINQYTIKDMIGRGSYGAVHLATDQFGNEYAIKEFSKARLRHQARSTLMRQLPFREGRFPAGGAPGRPFGRQSQLDSGAQADALYFIRKEIAIMKKLNHPNLVQLIEVLDDPGQDSLYMVLEMCKKGVIMEVGIGKPAPPLDLEDCRCWFRDLMLGIEYLHSQNIIHRDIKPDNLLITSDNVLKIGDFGVSEMFEKPENMRTTKNAGSPAFLPPELCASGQRDVDGTACDIWSMGVTLYCLRYGRIPFEYGGILDLYEAIRDKEIKVPPGNDAEDQHFVDVMHKLLEKDPARRITMAELREHPWVTKCGSDPLLSAEENCTEPVEPNALEVNHAFTRNMGHLLCVMKAIRKFKGLLQSRHCSPAASVENFSTSDILEPTSKLSSALTLSDNSSHEEGGLTEAEVARLVEERRKNMRKRSLQAAKILDMADDDGLATEDDQDTSVGQIQTATDGSSDSQESASQRPRLFLGIGTGGEDEFLAEEHQQAQDNIVSESPGAAEFDIYEQAFQQEIHRIQQKSRLPNNLFSNNVVDKSTFVSAVASLRPQVDGDAGLQTSPAAVDMPADNASSMGKGGTRSAGFADVVAMALKKPID